MSKQTCDQSIGCDVTNCTYNENGTKCTAQHIVVENKRATTQEIKDVATSQGMTTMRQDGINQILQGITTSSEVLQYTI